MEILNEKQIFERLDRRQPFAARFENGGFEIRVARYLPLVVTAIHDGHRVSEALAAQMKVTDEQRLFEEDPHTGAIAEAFDISAKVIDSRYCGDLNRRPEQCIYEEAWGHQVWKTPLDERERKSLQERHAAYYRVLNRLLQVLSQEFGGTLLYDLHSYNYQRLEGSPPLFNIGTHYVNLQRFGPVVDHLLGELAAIKLPGCATRAVADEVFEGRGYQAEFVHQHHPEVLCVPLEIKKEFMDERNLALQEPLYTLLREQMIDALQRTFAFFQMISAPNREKQ